MPRTAPRPGPAGAARRAGGAGRVLMIGIGGGVDAGQALAPAHEIEQRLSASRGRRRDRSGRRGTPRGARQEDRVVLPQVLLVDLRGIVGHRRRPGARSSARAPGWCAPRAGSTSARSRPPCRGRAPCAAAAAAPAPSPGARPSSRPRRRGSASGSAAHGRRHRHRLLGAGAEGPRSGPSTSCSWPSPPPRAASHSADHLSRMAFSSARVSAPSLSASPTVNSAAATALR